MTRPVKEELTVVCYDIADNRRRREVVRIVEGYGVRVQESVFECWLSPAERRELERRIRRALRLDEDLVGYYALSAQDLPHVLVLGAGPGLSVNAEAIVV